MDEGAKMGLAPTNPSSFNLRTHAKAPEIHFNRLIGPCPFDLSVGPADECSFNGSVEQLGQAERLSSIQFTSFRYHWNFFHRDRQLFW